MPSKIQLDENLWFLYICLQNSDLKAIDFQAVGHATNLKPPAARMRYTRLRRQIENGTLIGTHGTPFTGGKEKIAEARSKRKRNPGQGQERKSEEEAGEGRQKNKKGKGVVKQEPLSGDDGDAFLEGIEESSSEEEDSEDEMPLAKRRGVNFNIITSRTGAGIRNGVGGLATARVQEMLNQNLQPAGYVGHQVSGGVASGQGHDLMHGYPFVPMPQYRAGNGSEVSWNFAQAQCHRSV